MYLLFEGKRKSYKNCKVSVLFLFYFLRFFRSSDLFVCARVYECECECVSFSVFRSCVFVKKVIFTCSRLFIIEKERLNGTNNINIMFLKSNPLGLFLFFAFSICLSFFFLLKKQQQQNRHNTKNVFNLQLR